MFASKPAMPPSPVTMLGRRMDSTKHIALANIDV